MGAGQRIRRPSAKRVLRSLDHNFQCSDAILELADPDNPKEPDWPKVDFIVGNPPFLGDKFMRRELGDEFVTHSARSTKGAFRGSQISAATGLRRPELISRAEDAGEQGC